MRILLLFFFSLFLSTYSLAQNQNSIWCFGDSAGIDFSNTSFPVTFSSAVDSRGSCASISDSTGHLVFYVYNVAGNGGRSTRVMNNNHQLMDNGDSVIGEGWYQEYVIVPMPDSSGYYYLFSIGLGGLPTEGLYYSVINMNQNGGLGKVILKNIQLSNVAAFDGFSAVKHGNGRDWWLLFKPDGHYNSPNNDFYIYFISPLGISVADTQSIGFIVTNTSGSISFNRSGTKMLMTSWRNLIQTIDFDRCEGILSNVEIIEPENNFQYRSHFRSCFSPNAELIYLTNVPQSLMDSSHYLFQYDLLAGNILASRDTIFTMIYPNDMAGLQLAPDNKIYLSTWYQCNAWCFPYPDSVFNSANMNLSVVNSPNNLSSSCDFQPNSFYLGGKRSYIGFPNNPDYTLGPLTGSTCDSLPLITEEKPLIKKNLNVYYHHSWDDCFINAEGLLGKYYRLDILNLMGQSVYSEEGALPVNYLSRKIKCGGFSNEIYVVRIQTEREELTKKFIKN